MSSQNDLYQSMINESLIENALTVNGDLTVTGNIIGEIVGAAGKLKTTGADVTVSASAQPDAGGGDVLVATDGTNAVWGGAGYLKTGGFGSTLKIDVGNSYPPLAGQVLTSASSSFADWQTPLVSGTQIVDTFSLIRRDQGLPLGDTRGENSVDFQRDRTLSNQVATGVNSVICGGSWNKNDSEQGFIGGGINNRISSTNFGSVIVGGLNSEISSAGQGNFIGSGNDNDITAGQYSVIAGGFDNLVNASNACIGGGNVNICLDPNGFIGGGINNRLSSGNNSNAICAGQNNDITGGFYSFVGGGNNNNIARNRCVIAGGENNDIAGSADYASILGGQNNNINAGTSTICGGKNHDITSGAGHFVGGGEDNNVNGGAFSSIVGGKTNTMSQSYSCIAGGRTSTVSHEGVFMFSPKPLAYVSTAPNTAYFDVDKLQVEGNIQCADKITMGAGVTALERDADYDSWNVAGGAGDLTSAFASTYIGLNAGSGNTGNFNTCIGYDSGGSGGQQNTFVGGSAGDNITGGNNVCMGFNAGNSLTGSNNCLMLGADADGIAGADEQIAIGSNVTCDSAGQTMIGSTGCFQIVNQGDNVCDLGSATHRFENLFMGGTAHVGGAIISTGAVNGIITMSGTVSPTSIGNYAVIDDATGLTMIVPTGYTVLRLNIFGTNIVSSTEIGGSLTDGGAIFSIDTSLGTNGAADINSSGASGYVNNADLSSFGAPYISASNNSIETGTMRIILECMAPP